MTSTERERLRAEINRVQRGRLRSLQREPRFPWEGPSRNYEAQQRRKHRREARSG